MNRGTFLKTSSAATAVASFAPLARAATGPIKSENRTSTAIAAYYLRAQMYTCVPRQIREDMEWMAGIGTNYVCVGGRDGTEVIFTTIEGHGHIWPGGKSPLPEFILGKATSRLNATDAVWEFFQAHPKPTTKP